MLILKIPVIKFIFSDKTESAWWFHHVTGYAIVITATGCRRAQKITEEKQAGDSLLFFLGSDFKEVAIKHAVVKNSLWVDRGDELLSLERTDGGATCFTYCRCLSYFFSSVLSLVLLRRHIITRRTDTHLRLCS